MFFEGSEKKVEVMVPSSLNLLEIETGVWENLVEASRATIISEISNDFCKAYLLSESSLFIWKDRLVLITCGQTTLVKAIEFLLEKFGKDNISSLIFQRKNEYFSHLQKSSFIDDVELLDGLISGNSYRFGKMHEHHTFMFCSDSEYVADEDDKTSEVLMYDISKQASQILNRKHDDPKEIRNFLQLEKLFPGYVIDDFAFDPCGYSVNAIKDENYFTIHITPEEFNSYISFETNEPMRKSKLEGLIEILRPETFDVVSFNCEKAMNVPAGYAARAIVKEKINLGYNVCFGHFYHKETVNEGAYLMNLKERK